MQCASCTPWVNVCSALRGYKGTPGVHSLLLAHLVQDGAEPVHRCSFFPAPHHYDVTVVVGEGN